MLCVIWYFVVENLVKTIILMFMCRFRHMGKVTTTSNGGGGEAADALDLTVKRPSPHPPPTAASPGRPASSSRETPSPPRLLLPSTVARYTVTPPAPADLDCRPSRPAADDHAPVTLWSDSVRLDGGERCPVNTSTDVVGDDCTADSDSSDEDEDEKVDCANSTIRPASLLPPQSLTSGQLPGGPLYGPPGAFPAAFHQFNPLFAYSQMYAAQMAAAASTSSASSRPSLAAAAAAASVFASHRLPPPITTSGLTISYDEWINRKLFTVIYLHIYICTNYHKICYD